MQKNNDTRQKADSQGDFSYHNSRQTKEAAEAKRFRFSTFHLPMTLLTAVGTNTGP